MRTEVANAAAEAARVRFVRYCRAQGWDCWGLWLAMGYDDDWLGSLYHDGKPLADPPALPMPTVAELRRGALYLGVSFERLLEAAWGVSTSSLAAHDARSFGERTPRRFGIPQPSGLLTGPWPGGSSGAAGPPPEAGSIWAATLEGIRSGRGDVVHCVCRRLGEAIVALHVAPAWEPEDFWAAPALRPRAASHEGRSVTVGFDGKLGALSRLETRLDEVVRWAFGDLVDLRRAPTGLQPGLALQLTTAESSGG